MNKFKLLTIVIVILMMGLFNINYGISEPEKLSLTKGEIESIVIRFMDAEKNGDYKVLAEFLATSEEIIKESLEIHYINIKKYIEERLGFIFIKIEFIDYKIIEIFPDNRAAVTSQIFRIYFKDKNKLRYVDEYTIFSVLINTDNTLLWRGIFNNKGWYHDVK